MSAHETGFSRIEECTRHITNFTISKTKPTVHFDMIIIPNEHTKNEMKRTIQEYKKNNKIK